MIVSPAQALADQLIIDELEKAQIALDGIASILAQRYDADVHTPYLGENIGDIRRAIERSVMR